MNEWFRSETQEDRKEHVCSREGSHMAFELVPDYPTEPEVRVGPSLSCWAGPGLALAEGPGLGLRSSWSAARTECPTLAALPQPGGDSALSLGPWPRAHLN